MPPVNIPANAPCQEVFFQKSEKTITGPNADPNPAQAFPTKFRIESFGVNDSNTAITATIKTDKRLAVNNCFGVAFLFKNAL